MLYNCLLIPLYLRTEIICRDPKAPKPAGWQVLSTHLGSELKGLQYEPLFPYFKDHASECALPCLLISSRGCVCTFPSNGACSYAEQGSALVLTNRHAHTYTYTYTYTHTHEYTKTQPLKTHKHTRTRCVLFLALADAFCVLSDKYVSDESGTGVVHQVGFYWWQVVSVASLASTHTHTCTRTPYFFTPRPQSPGHGEDDWRVCMAHGVIVKKGPLPCPVDLEGKFMPVITDYAGE